MNERNSRTPAGAVFFAVCAIFAFGGAYAMYPPVLFGGSLADMTAGVWLRATASLVLALIGLEFGGALAIVLLSDA